MGTFLSIGECMVELSQAGDGLLRKGFAGDTFNTAWYARACLPSDWYVDYFTAVGDDALSDEMLAFMQSAGIGTSRISRVQGGRPGLYLIDVKDGERTFSYWRDASAARRLAADGGRLREAIDSADIIYFSGITLAILNGRDVETMLWEMRRAKDLGKLIVFDPNLRPRLWSGTNVMKSTVTEGARVSTMVMPSFDDEATHFGDISIEATMARYRSLGAEYVVVKNGADGAKIGFGQVERSVPAVKVKRVVDTTSAGDSFNGAFLAAFLVNGHAVEACQKAAQIAAKVIGEHGALVPFERL